MPNITYLLGAGASANSLPLGDKLPEEMVTIMSELTDKFSVRAVGNYLEDAKEVVERMGSGTPDLYARRLFLTRKFEELQRLKLVLCYYFTMAQLLKPKDIRYSYFLATVIDDRKTDPSLRDDINIISWNYDLQFEFTAFDYFNVNTLEDLHWHVQIFPYYNQLGIEPTTRLIKLNGTANILQNPKGDEIIYISDLISNPVNLRSLFEDILKHYDSVGNLSRTLRPNLTFAWEKAPYNNETVSMAIKYMAKTDILVVIGYSFPTFNRNIDRQLIRAYQHTFYEQSKDEKVIYLQVPRDRYDDIKTRIESLVGKELVRIRHIDHNGEFYIPFEF